MVLRIVDEMVHPTSGRRFVRVQWGVRCAFDARSTFEDYPI